jgi:hypothetical protein
MTFESLEPPINHDALGWESLTPEHAEQSAAQIEMPTDINPEEGQNYNVGSNVGHSWQEHDILPTDDRTGDDPERDDNIPPASPSRFIPGQRQSGETWNPDDAYIDDEDDEPADDGGEPPFLPPFDPPTGGNGEGDDGDDEGDDEGDSDGDGENVPIIDPTLFIPDQRPGVEGPTVGGATDNTADTESASEQPNESSQAEATDQPETLEEHVEPTLEAGTSQRFSYDDGPEEIEYGGGEIIIPSDSVAVARSNADEQVTLTAVNDGSHVITFHHSGTGESGLVNITAAGTATMQEVSEELVGHLLASTPALGKAGVKLTILGQQNPENTESTESAGVAGVGSELREFLSLLRLPEEVVLPEPADIPNGSNIRVNTTTGEVIAIDRTGRQVYPPTE